MIDQCWAADLFLTEHVCGVLCSESELVFSLCVCVGPCGVAHTLSCVFVITAFVPHSPAILGRERSCSPQMLAP